MRACGMRTGVSVSVSTADRRRLEAIVADRNTAQKHVWRARIIRLRVIRSIVNDTQDFVAELREINVTPHLAQNVSGRRSAIDGRTTRHAGYDISQRIRKRIEKAFGWAKTVTGLRKARHRGLPEVDWQFTFAMAAYNLVRLPKLLSATL